MRWSPTRLSASLLTGCLLIRIIILSALLVPEPTLA